MATTQKEKRIFSLSFAQSDPREMLWLERLSALPTGHGKQLILLLLESLNLDLGNKEVFVSQVIDILRERKLGKFQPKESMDVEHSQGNAIEHTPQTNPKKTATNSDIQAQKSNSTAAVSQKKDNFGSLAI